MRLGTGASESMTAINSLPKPPPSMRQLVKRKALTTAYFNAGVRDRFALTVILRRAARASESERWSIVDCQRPHNRQFQLHFPCIHHYNCYQCEHATKALIKFRKNQSSFPPSSTQYQSNNLPGASIKDAIDSCGPSSCHHGWLQLKRDSNVSKCQYSVYAHTRICFNPQVPIRIKCKCNSSFPEPRGN